MIKALGSTFSRGTTRDFNETGARLVIQEPVRPGHSMVVHLKLEAQRVLSLLATVIWTKDADSGQTHEVGIRFQEGCRGDRQRLNNWLHRRRLAAFI